MCEAEIERQKDGVNNAEEGSERTRDAVAENRSWRLIVTLRPAAFPVIISGLSGHYHLHPRNQPFFIAFLILNSLNLITNINEISLFYLNVIINFLNYNYLLFIY